MDTEKLHATLAVRRLSAERDARMRIAGFDQKTLADRLNVSPSMISHILSGRRRTLWLRVAIASLIGNDYADFWGEPQPELTLCDTIKLRNVGIGKNGN